MLLRAVHHLQDHAALACQPYSALPQRLLQVPRRVRGIDALAGRNATSGSGGHSMIVQQHEWGEKAVQPPRRARIRRHLPGKRVMQKHAAGNGVKRL
jgi:hypothetical protein